MEETTGNILLLQAPEFLDLMNDSLGLRVPKLDQIIHGDRLTNQISADAVI